MSPEDYAELSPRIVGKNATRREIDAAWHALGRYPTPMVVSFLTRSPGISVRDLGEACARQTLAQAAREREPQTCEHGHSDTPVEPCPECRPARAEAAHRGAEACRRSLAEAKR